MPPRACCPVCTNSVGAPSGDSVERLIRRADEALLAAKRAGRNCVVVAESPEAESLASSATIPMADAELAEPALSACE